MAAAEGEHQEKQDRKHSDNCAREQDGPNSDLPRPMRRVCSNKSQNRREQEDAEPRQLKPRNETQNGEDAEKDATQRPKKRERESAGIRHLWRRLLAVAHARIVAGGWLQLGATGG
jgi:hypothetical protein